MSSLSPGVVTGNPLRAHGTRNPVGRYLLSRFERDLELLWNRAGANSMLDVGCGEGILTLRFAQRPGVRKVVGVDVEDPRLRAEWATRGWHNLEYRAADACSLPFDDCTFDVVAAIEVLEHLADPEQALAEMARVSSQYLLASVPCEPLWRILNVARGAYWRTLGNSPGHVNHWSKRAFLDLMAQQGRLLEVRSPMPWTMALVALGGARA
jgi:SAM-dependent methyltransferase